MLYRHGSLECAILSALWQLERNGTYKNTVKDVYGYLLNNSSEKRAYTTIKTVMDRLEDKKVLIRFKESKRFYYRTVYSNHDMIIENLNQIASRYCYGDLNKLKDVINLMIDEKSLVSV